MNKMAKHPLKDTAFVLCGILGSIIVLYGQNFDPASPAYPLGSILLFITALYFRLTYFIALELIKTAGHGAAFLNISSQIQIAIPILLSLQLLLYYFMTGPWNNPSLFFGVIGVLLFSIGFAYDYPWLYTLGALGIATYSYSCAIKGENVCYIWAVLNSLFVLGSLYYIIQG